MPDSDAGAIDCGDHPGGSGIPARTGAMAWVFILRSQPGNGRETPLCEDEHLLAEELSYPQVPTHE
jgi:hypothetical protein